MEAALEAPGEIAPEVVEVVSRAWLHGGLPVACSWMRGREAAVAAAASSGLITTEIPGVGFGRIWRATHAGVEILTMGERDD